MEVLRAMNEKPPEAIITSMSGTYTFQRNLGLPFLTDVVETLGAAGVPELDDQHDFTRPPWWSGRGSEGPTAFLDPVTFVFSLCLFSRTPLAEWAIGRVCYLVWDKAAKPAVTRLLGRRADGGADTRTI